jgi:hypothetical protein
VGYGIAAQLEIVHLQAFRTLSHPSPLSMYTAARELHTPAHSGLSDKGCYPRLAAKALRAVGIPSEDAWPSVKSNVNKRLPFRVAVQSNGRKGADYVFIKGGAPARIEGIRQALAAGYPVGFGALVAKSYLRDEGPHVVTVSPKSDPIIGGHYQVIVGVTENQNFRVRNSWGRDWRDSGYCWMTPDYITSALCSDFMIIYGWEAIRNVRPAFNL